MKEIISPKNVFLNTIVICLDFAPQNIIFQEGAFVDKGIK